MGDLKSCMRITATEARNRFGSLCAQVKRGPMFTERAGRIDTVILPVEAYQALQSHQVKFAPLRKKVF